MPLSTPTYGVFQGLYNGGGDTPFIGLYASGAIGHSYQVIGIVFAVDKATDNKAAFRSPVSATPYYIFQTNARSSAKKTMGVASLTESLASQKIFTKNPVSAVIENLAQAISKSLANNPVTSAALTLLQGNEKVFTKNPTGATTLSFAQYTAKTLANKPASSIIGTFAQAVSKSQAGYKTQATSLIEATTSSRATGISKVSSEYVVSSTDGVKSVANNPTSAVAEILAQSSSRNQNRIFSSQASLTQVTTSGRKTMLSRVSYASAVAVAVAASSRALFRTNATAEKQGLTNYKLQTRVVASQIALRETARELRVRAIYLAGSISLFDFQTAIATISNLNIYGAILFQDYYDTYTNKEVNTVSYAEPSEAVVEEPTANATFQEDDVSSFTDRKWNNS